MPMGYLYLLLALLAGVTKGYCGKKTSGYIDGFRGSVLANTVRMFLCVGIGFGVVLLEGNAEFLLPGAKLLCISALSGISTVIFVVSWLISVRKNAYMLMDIFLMVGVLVPIGLSAFFFGETVKWTQWIGIAVLLASAMILCSYSSAIKTTITLPALLLLIVCGSASGLVSFSQKLFTKTLPVIPASVFNFYTYLFAAVMLGSACLLLRKDGSDPPGNLWKNTFGYIVVLAICLFLNSYFKTLAAASLSAVILYPLSQGASLLLSGLMASVMFREKLTAKAALGMIMTFIGLLITNL